MQAQEDCEELEVTVDVVPSTVTEIVYLRNENERVENENSNDVTFGDFYGVEAVAVDSASLENCSLVVDDANQSIVFVTSEFIEAGNAEEVVKETQNSSGLGEFICEQCNFKCRSFSSLKKHSHLNKSSFAKCQYTCNVCNKKFNKAQILSHHFRVEHELPKDTLNKLQNEQEIKKFNCFKCEKEFKDLTEFENHKKTHLNELLYACNKCGQSFSTTSEVSIHLRYFHPLNKASYETISETKENNLNTDEDVVECKKRKT